MRYKHTLKLMHEGLINHAISDQLNANAKPVETNTSANMDHALLYIVKGNIEFIPSKIGSENTANNNAIVATAGSLVLLPSISHQPTYTSDDYEAWRLSFCPGCMYLHNNASLSRYFLQARNGLTSIAVIEDEHRTYLISLFNKLKFQVNHIDQSDIDIVRSLIILILAEVNQASLSQQRTITPIKVVEALGYIEQHYKQSISLKDVALNVHSSPAHLATLVKKYTDFSVGQWILRHRMTEACLLLTHSQESIDSIAEKTGWGDSTNFIRQFKKYKKLTPFQWKKAILQQETQS